MIESDTRLLAEVKRLTAELAVARADVVTYKAHADKMRGVLGGVWHRRFYGDLAVGGDCKAAIDHYDQTRRT